MDYLSTLSDELAEIIVSHVDFADWHNLAMTSKFLNRMVAANIALVGKMTLVGSRHYDAWYTKYASGQLALYTPLFLRRHELLPSGGDILSFVRVLTAKNSAAVNEFDERTLRSAIIEWRAQNIYTSAQRGIIVRSSIISKCIIALLNAECHDSLMIVIDELIGNTTTTQSVLSAVHTDVSIHISTNDPSLITTIMSGIKHLVKIEKPTIYQLIIDFWRLTYVIDDRLSGWLISLSQTNREFILVFSMYYGKSLPLTAAATAAAMDNRWPNCRRIVEARFSEQ